MSNRVPSESSRYNNLLQLYAVPSSETKEGLCSPFHTEKGPFIPSCIVRIPSFVRAWGTTVFILVPLVLL